MHMKSHAFCSSIQIKTQPLRNTQLHVHYVHSNSSLNLLDPPCHFFTQACPVSMPTSLYSTHIQILQSLVSIDRPQLGYNQILLILLFSYLSPQYCGIWDHWAEVLMLEELCYLLQVNSVCGGYIPFHLPFYPAPISLLGAVVFYFFFKVFMFCTRSSYVSLS